MNEITHPLPKKRFEMLAAKNDPQCVSVYLPMYKAGKEQNESLGQGHLKNCLKKVHKTLVQHQIHENEIKAYLKPIKELISNVNLWRNPSDGLAIFLDHQEGMQHYVLPISFETRTYVADHFYLEPLLPLYHTNGIYHLLELSQDHVKLYKCTRNSFEDLFVEEFTPEQLEEAVGFDFEQKMLQFRTGHALYSAGSFHGQGEGKDDAKKELITFFRQVDKGVNRVITDKKAPLVLACVDWLYPVYKKTNSYPNLYHKSVSGDPEFKNKSQLHKESWKFVQDYFERTMKEKIVQFKERSHTPKTSYQISEIVPAAVNGKIDTLFVRKGTEVFGTYNIKKKCVIIDSEKDLYNVSLINMTSVDSFLQGGKVYVMEPEDMPVKKRSMNALFRY